MLVSFIRPTLLSGFLTALLTNALAADIGTEETGIGNAVDVVILGAIQSGDAERFRQTVISQIKHGKLIGSVKIFSPGGSAFDSMSIGRQVRALRATTHAPHRVRASTNAPMVTNLCMTFYKTSGGSFRYNISTRAGDPRCTCASGCFLIWAAGYGRQGDVLGVHRMRWEDFHFSSYEQTQTMYEQAISSMSGYLRSMDVPDNVIRLMMNTPSSTMYFLNKSDLAPMVGDPPALDEMIAQRCRGLSTKPTPVGNGGYTYSAHAKCAQSISEEASRIGSRQFMAKYGAGMPSD